MKIAIKNLLFVFALIIFNQGFSQYSTILQTAQSITKNICQRWKPTSGVNGGIKYIVTKAIIIEFRKDGSFIDSNQDVNKGRWTYDPAAKLLEMIDKDGKTKAIVVELTPDKMVLDFDSLEMANRVTYTKVD